MSILKFKMRANPLGYTNTPAVVVATSSVNSVDVKHDDRPSSPARLRIMDWVAAASLLVGVASVVMSGIVVWRIEHVHTHVAEVIAQVYACDGRPSNTSVCGVVAHL